MNAIKTIKIVGLASLMGFIGAAQAPKAAPKQIKATPAAATVARTTDNNNAELLQEATTAAAVYTPAAVRRVRVIRMEVTAYCACTKCCGENAEGITASGRPVSYNNSRFVAADTDVLPFRTKLVIPGYDAAPVEVIDRGGAIKGNKLDLFFPTHEEALEWGRQMVDVTVVE
jgi:3D (Asp-Asp-Asp) domain-containing protein